MAEGGDSDTMIDEEWEKLKTARRIQELFHGRFTLNEVMCGLRHFEWDSDRTSNFLLESEADEVRRVLGLDENEWQLVLPRRERARRDNKVRDNVRRNNIDFEYHQFGCQPCDNMWWGKVPTRKPVRRCKVCTNRYDPVPREREWGWAQFNCQCGNEFHGFGAMGRRSSPCFECSYVCAPTKVLPPLKDRPRRRRSQYRHACTAANCYNRRIPAPHDPIIQFCAHPRSIGKKVLFPSDNHRSTGSTVKTFLTQDDLDEPWDFYEPSLADIEEVRGDDGDNR